MLQRQLDPPKPEEGAAIVETRELEVPKLASVEAPPLRERRRLGQICCCLRPGCYIGPIVTVELGIYENLEDARRRLWKRIEGDDAYTRRFQEMARAGLIELE